MYGAAYMQSAFSSIGDGWPVYRAKLPMKSGSSAYPSSASSYSLNSNKSLSVERVFA
jgi:hypothetical protein